MALSATAREGYGPSRGTYETDLSEEQMALVLGWLPPPLPGGRPRKTDMGEVVSAILYLLKTGCQWHMLPKVFPPASTVYGYFQRWRRLGIIDRLHAFLRGLVRVREGRDVEPTVAVLDAQTVKASPQALEEVGFDAAKKTKGRKCSLLVDSLGLVLCVHVHGAGVQDRDGAVMLFEKMGDAFPLLDTIYADGGYAGEKVASAAPAPVVIVKRTQPGFVVLAKRWRVERTFGWRVQSRRMARDYEGYASTSEALFLLWMIRLMLRRLMP